MEDIQISVVIPVKNGDSWIEDCIKGILHQTLSAQTEILVIDSGSTDNSISLIKQFPVKLITIAPEEFNHGSTRNMAVIHARGEYVVMTVQDAIADDNTWLQKLLDGFVDENVAGVCGQQIVPHDADKNPVEWFRPQQEPKLIRHQFENADAFNLLSPKEKRKVCGWDNVTAMYRKDILQKTPFGKINFAEDVLWAQDALLSGYAIVYNYAARVRHFHFETPEYTVKRCFAVYYHFYKIFGLKPEYSVDHTKDRLKRILLIFRATNIGWREKIKWISYNNQLIRNLNRAVRIFFEALEQGEQQLDEEYEHRCSAPPLAVKSPMQ